MEKEEMERDNKQPESLETHKEAANENQENVEAASGCCDSSGEDKDCIDIETLQQQLDDATRKKDEYLALAQRVQADFENFKKRNRSAVADAYKVATLETVEAFLPVLDNLERALDSVKETNGSNGSEALCKGVEMVIKQFKDILKKLEVEEIEALGKPFDPKYHNAVMQVEAQDEEQKNTVVEVLQKGYKHKDRVIRYSMVKVAN